MAKKFIDAEILIDELSASCMPIFEKGISGILGDEQSIADVIREQPSADVQEVKHGHWKQRMSTLTSVKCSECGTYHEYDTRYCPHCGARMDGDENAKTNLRKP